MAAHAHQAGDLRVVALHRDASSTVPVDTRHGHRTALSQRERATDADEVVFVTRPHRSLIEAEVDAPTRCVQAVHRCRGQRHRAGDAMFVELRGAVDAAQHLEVDAHR